MNTKKINSHVVLEKPIAVDPIAKGITVLAKALFVEINELQEWMNMYSQVPTKTLLQLIHTAIRYELNPLLGEIIFEEMNLGNWQAFISIDGWYRILNKQPHFQGLTFGASTELIENVPLWMECTIYRSDRTHPMTVREYYIELKTEHIAWQKLPRRMLRHRTLQQCMRLAFGIASPEHYLGPSLTPVPPKPMESWVAPTFTHKMARHNRIDLVKSVLQQESHSDAR
jgi:hypothetical protein